MPALIISLLTSVFGSLFSFFKQKNDNIAAKQEADKEIQLAEVTADLEKTKAEYEKESTALKSTSSAFKDFTFFMWFAPFIIGVVYPKWGAVIFDNLANLPVWYSKSCIYIMFTIWGINVTSAVASGIFSNFQDFVSERRVHKEEMAKIVTQVASPSPTAAVVPLSMPIPDVQPTATPGSIDRQAFYNAIRKINGNVTQDDLNRYEPIFNQLDKDA